MGQACGVKDPASWSIQHSKSRQQKPTMQTLLVTVSLEDSVIAVDPVTSDEADSMPPLRP